MLSACSPGADRASAGQPPLADSIHGTAIPESRHLHDDLQSVYPCGRPQPAHHEVDGRDAAAQDHPPCLRHTGHDTQHQPGGDNLPGEDRWRTAEQDRGDDEARRSTVTRLEEITDRIEVEALRDTVQAGSDSEREHQRAETGRSDPPPCWQSLRISEFSRTDRASRAEVGREESREQKRRRQLPAGDEEVLRPSHRTRCPGSDQEEEQAVDD